MHPLQSLGFSTTAMAEGQGSDLHNWKEFSSNPSQWRRNHSRKRSPRKLTIKHKITKDPLSMDNPDNPSRIRNNELIRHGCAIEHRCIHMEHNPSYAHSFSPSLIWACCHSEDLFTGIRIHNEVQKRGLAEKNYSDALATMYAKCGEHQKAQALLDTQSSSCAIPWTALIECYARQGQGQNALDCFEQMQREGISPNAMTYVWILKACAVIGALDKGKQNHHEILKQGWLEHHKVLGGALVDMYAKCGALLEAQSVLEKLPFRNAFSWNALIAGYARNGQGHQALELLEQMQQEGTPPNATTYLYIVKACAVIKAFDKGKQIHDEILRQGLLEHNIVLGNVLVDMYAKCGALRQARSVLQKLSSRDVVSWSALIAGYAQQEQGQQALECYEKMQREGISPNAVTYLCVLKSCAAIGAIGKGKQIHEEILRQGLLEQDIMLGNALVDMYAKCGAFVQARSVLEQLPSRDVISWNALIAGFSHNRQGYEALECLKQMQQDGCRPNAVTYVCALNACAVIGAIDKGKQIHDKISRQGFLEHNKVLGGALVDMYAKCGALCQAQSVLENLPARDVVSWNAVIAGYAQNGQGQQALELFEQMQCEGILPDAVTYACILKACAVIGAIDKGKKIHDEILRQGLLEHNVVLGGALVEMYAKCGALFQAESILKQLPCRNVVSWSALITGYARKGQGEQALEYFEEMQHEGIPPDVMTYVCVLKACAMIGDIDRGKEIHDEISRQGLLEHDIQLGNALVDMYAKCGALDEARSVLEKLPVCDAASWNALIAGHAQTGWGWQALECYEQMKREGIPLDAVTYVCILKACALIGSIDKGKQIHGEITRQGLLEHDIVLGGALVDMYVKCAALPLAKSVLKKLPFRDVVLWNTLIAGYAQECQGKQALESFQQMQREGVLPDIVTFRCLLSLCSHLGLVEKGQELFNSMGGMYGLKPDVECFTSMVDLLARAGHLVNAVEVIQEMPYLADSATWICLLGACQKWVDVNVGILAFEQALQLDKCDGTAYVLLVNIYAAAGMPEKVKEIGDMRPKKKAWKQPRCSSWTDSSHKMHKFCAVDTKCAQSKDIPLKLKEIANEMSLEGYFSNFHRFSHDMSVVLKAHMQCQHSEKIVLA